MKAIICTKYEPPEIMQIKEIEKPAPKDNEAIGKDVKLITIGDPAFEFIDFRMALILSNAISPKM
jgi:hypothetical protein